MKRRPLIVTVLSIFYLLAPLWILIEFQVFFNINLVGNEWFYLLSYHVAFMVSLTMLAGYGMYKVRPWGYYLVILHSLIVIVNNTILLFRGISGTSLYLGITFNLIMLTIFFLFLRKEIYSPYFNPRLRWWEQAKRFITKDLNVTIYDEDKNLGEHIAFDLSETGVFVKIKDSIQTLNLEKKYNLEIALNTDSIVNVYAQAMWINNEERPNIPIGVGFKFLSINRTTKKNIKNYIKQSLLMERQR